MELTPGWLGFTMASAWAVRRRQVVDRRDHHQHAQFAVRRVRLPPAAIAVIHRYQQNLERPSSLQSDKYSRGVKPVAVRKTGWVL